MKRIILPTDFSATSKNAAKYAHAIAQIFDAEILILHAFYPAVELNTGYMINPEIEDKRKLELQAFTEEVRGHSSGEVATLTKIKSKFIIGFPIDEIVSHSMEPDQIIVMGATGSSGVMGRLFGSVSSNVVKQAGCPVLLVPNEVEFAPYTNMMYACDQTELDVMVENSIEPWLAKFDVKMHIVHVNDRPGEVSHTQGVFKHLPAEKVARAELESSAVVEALNQYGKAHKIDLLILSTRRKSFWDRLVHVSVTREMALQPDLPILVLHDKDQKGS